MAVDPFVHLHVASGFSLRHGADKPAALINRAAELGQDVLALTDRDGLYGAARFAIGCRQAGIGAVLGVDLPVRSTGAMPPPARPDELRVTVMAKPGSGWRALCRMVSAGHPQRPRDEIRLGAQPLNAQVFSQYSEDIYVLLGPFSEIGYALANRRPDLADKVLDRWCEVIDRSALRIEIVSHLTKANAPLSTAHAARMLGWAISRGVAPVLTNIVRYCEPRGAMTADILDSARRLVPLSERNRDRGNAQGYLKSGQQMAAVAAEITQAAGMDPHRAGQQLLRDTRAFAQSLVLDPVADLGIGSVHVPELSVIGGGGVHGDADRVLRERCLAGVGRLDAESNRQQTFDRLEDELRTVADLGFAGYFLCVADVVDIARGRGIRVAARGSGAGSLINFLLGISGVEPIRYGLIMERFLSPLRRALPDIDIDVESARRTEVYDAIIERYGTDRVACVSMMDTYRVRHAIRDVGAALGMPRGDIDAFAKAFPHIRARDARSALADLPELRASGLGRLAAKGELDGFFSLVESLDGLPRHVAMHPCGVLLSDVSLLDRTPVEPSAGGYPMSQFDKDDVEEMGFLKLDVLGIRMQSAMSHAAAEINRIEGEPIDLDAIALDDPATYELVQSTKTLGCFQIESPGQRELIGKFAPSTFSDLIIDISLFRPGPVKSDMITPFLKARQGWEPARYPHPDLEPILAETGGVVVFHEQVIRIVACMTGCTLAEADETRRTLGSIEGIEDVRAWFYPAALSRGYRLAVIEEIWEVLRAFASFGFCKAHAAAFALPTYQSAWLKTHYPAAFLAGVLTHDPGMYPKRLILDDARQLGIEIRGLDVNLSDISYRVERTDTGYAIRMALAEVKGINDDEMKSIVQQRPFSSMADMWSRASVSRPTLERLILAGAFDEVHGVGTAVAGVGRRGRLTRRDLLLQAADLDRTRVKHAAADQMLLEMTVIPDVPEVSGLPEMTAAESVRAELDVLGLDVSHHVVDFYEPMLKSLRVTRSKDLLSVRSGAQVFIAGVKVMTQTPPMRSGRRVIFVTLDDATGPVDATFFEDAQRPYAATIFHSWLLLIRGVVRRTGPKGVSIRATGAWELSAIREVWATSGIDGLNDFLAVDPRGPQGAIDDELAKQEREQRPASKREFRPMKAGGMGQRRTLVQVESVNPLAGTNPPGRDSRSARPDMTGLKT